MPDRLKLVALMLGLAGPAACHTDPFSVKPEVNVTLPDRAPAPADAEDPAGEDTSGGSEGTNT